MLKPADPALMKRVILAQKELAAALSDMADRMTPDQKKAIPSPVLTAMSNILMELAVLIQLQRHFNWATAFNLSAEEDPNVS